MTASYRVIVLDEAADDLRRLEDFIIERESASQTPDWRTPQRALEAIQLGLAQLAWSPYSFRKAALGNGRTRELIVPFGAAGYVVLFEICGAEVIVAAVRHQLEHDYRR